MKNKLYLSILLASALSYTSAYALDKNPQPNFNPSTVSQVNNKENIQKYGEILAWLVILNKNEIELAKVALKKNVDSPVKQYADMMVKDHTKNLKATLTLSEKIDIKPQKTTEVLSLKEKGKKELATLSPLKKEDFQKQYIDMIVKDHTEALQTLDQYLTEKDLPSLLEKHLKVTREHVALHLQKAKTIQNS